MAEKLEWQSTNENTTYSWVAFTRFGIYHVFYFANPNRWIAELSNGPKDQAFRLTLFETKEIVPSVDDAKAAAQRDYELRCDAEEGRLVERPTPSPSLKEGSRHG